MEGNAAAAAAEQERSNTYEHLRALLSLENPTCQICTEDIHELNANSCASCHDKNSSSAGPTKVRLVPMPHCKCRTTLASVHVRPTDLPLPPPIGTTDATDQSTFLQALLNSQPCLSGDTPKHKRMGAFTPRKLPTTTYSHRTTCTDCLPQWTKSANDVQKYNYNDDPEGNEMCFTNDVRCAQCNRVFAKRTVDRLMAGDGAGGTSKDDDEWTRSVEHTAKVVTWADNIKAWAKRELAEGNNNKSDQPSSEQQLTLEQSHLRSVLLSIIKGDASPSIGEDGVHRQELQHGEMKRELMQRDPKFAQEVEDMEYVRKLAEAEKKAAAEEERQRREADERMARELAQKEKEREGGAHGNGSAMGAAAAPTPGLPTIFASHQKQMRQREEEEKKSEELARQMQQQWEEEERRERDRREKRDAKLARKLYNADQHEKKDRDRKRKGSTALFGEPVRKSPFGAQSKQKQRQQQQPASRQDDVVDITDSPTKAAVDNSDDDYERIPPPSAAKMNVLPKACEKKEVCTEKEKDDKVHDLLVVNGSNSNGDGDGDNGEGEVDNNDDEPQLFTQAASPFPTPRSVDSSARKKPPPSSMPASIRKTPMPENATPRHRSGSYNGADFSADKKKEEDWDDEKNDSDLQFLVDMGFNWKEAKSCYLDADKNVEKAAAMLSSAMEERERAKKRG